MWVLQASTIVSRNDLFIVESRFLKTEQIQKMQGH